MFVAIWVGKGDGLEVDTAGDGLMRGVEMSKTGVERVKNMEIEGKIGKKSKNVKTEKGK